MTAAFLISVSEESSEQDRRFWVTCLGVAGRFMAGELCYSLESAKSLPAKEYDLERLKWREVKN